MAAPTLLTFATPLPQSARSSILEWRFPKPYHHLVLTGRSRAAWHTSFVIPQLNVLLDAGLCVNNLRPKHVFLTHGHNDHTLQSPAFVKREDPPDIFCPAEMVAVFEAFILANSMLNLGGNVSEEEARRGARWKPTSGGDREGGKDDGHGDEDDNDDDDDDDGGEDSETRIPKDAAPPHDLLRTHVTHGLRAGDTVPLRRVKAPPGITATAFACDHTVPCLGYVFSATRPRLQARYRPLPGQELKALRASGVDITEPATDLVFAFLGDTTAATLAAAPEWLRAGIPVVITECSFLHEEHRARAEKTKHTLWSDLEAVVRRWPATTFVLTHFSMRYSDADVRRFFQALTDPPANIVLWVDGLAEEL